MLDRDFLAILGRDHRTFLIGKISDANPEFRNFSDNSKLMIFSKFTWSVGYLRLFI